MMSVGENLRKRFAPCEMAEVSATFSFAIWAPGKCFKVLNRKFFVKHGKSSLDVDARKWENDNEI